MAKKTTTKPKEELYVLTMAFNGESHTVETDNVDEALKALKPDLLLSESYVTISKGDFMAERRLSRTQTQRVFLDDVTRDVFVMNLLHN